MSKLLLIPDIAKLRRKVAAPSPLLAPLVHQFRARLDTDPGFRAENLFLFGVLGEAPFVDEAARIISERAAFLGSVGSENGGVEHHTWCAAPLALRMAAYCTWLDSAGAISDSQREEIGAHLIAFCRKHVVAVLRSRTPTGDNQSLSMSLTCAVVGQAFAQSHAFAPRLRDYGLRVLRQTLGFLPPDGYTGEGSTYQSHVVAPLAMWASALLQQIDGPHALNQKQEPNGLRLIDLLRFATLEGSPGHLLPPWDHYGWQPKINLAAIAFHASVTGESKGLEDATQVWERPSFIAWGTDDRMWTLIYYPETEPSQTATPELAGWTLPATGAAIDHATLRSRTMLAWDESAGDLQSIGRMQVNPNHLMVEVGGVPIFGDGMYASDAPISSSEIEEASEQLSEGEKLRIAEQYGSLEAWVRAVRPGFIGTSNAIVIDGRRSYFPRSTRRGTLVGEERSPDRHAVCADAGEFYRPAFDVRQMRRLISVESSGVTWIVDRARADSVHRFTWQAFVPPTSTLKADSLQVVAIEQQLTIGWANSPVARLIPSSHFPAKGNDGLSWPWEGSLRIDLDVTATEAEFAVCLVPFWVANLHVRRVDERLFRATWAGGESTFALPDWIDRPVDPPAVRTHTRSDLDEMPFDLPDDDEATLIDAIVSPAPSEWRRTTAAMQSLAVQKNQKSMPRIERLLKDPSQRYLVHSVAAWCLGHTRYEPALPTLEKMSNCPEVNTAARCRWAIDAIRNPSQSPLSSKKETP